MGEQRYQPSERDAQRGLRDHLLEKAAAARAKHGALIDADAIWKILDDRDIVRYPTGIRFDGGPLRAGEFALAAPLGEHPRDGFCLFIHPQFEQQREAWPYLISYHLPPVSYGDIASAEDCELFGAALLGIDVESYYQTLCELTDSIPVTSAPAPAAADRNQP